MSLAPVFIILTMVFLVVLVLLLFTIMKGVGFKILFSVFKVRLKERKGVGHVRIVYPTGGEDLHAFNFREIEEGGFYEPIGKDKGKYIMRTQYISRNFFGIPTISYRAGDPEPINPTKWIPSAMSAIGLDTMFAKHARSQQTKDPLAEFIIKNFKLLALMVGILLGGLLFIILNQNDALATCTIQASKSVVINASNLV